MEIIRAEKSGFCYGVQRAMDITLVQAHKQNVYICGPLIHNNDVTEYLHQQGIGMIDSITQARHGDTVIIRSHGEPEEFYRAASKKGVNLIDATCVYVEKIHKIVKKAHEQGQRIIIIGSKEHQEVVATNGWCDYSATIIETLEDVEEYIHSAIHEATPPLIVCQTTLNETIAKDFIGLLKCSNVPHQFVNTICNATKERQESCRELAQKVDLMVVVGDSNSSNSRKLFEIAQKYCKNSIFVQNASNFLLKDCMKYNKIGVIAGASTPEWIIKEVIASMSENVKNNEKNPMMDFMDDIEKSLRLPKPGDIVEGKVDQVLDEAVIVNMGCKKDGILRKEEVALEEGQTLSDIFKEGDEIQAKVIKTDEGEGGILLSKKRLVAIENYKELEEAMKNKEIISVKFERIVNGGVIASYKEISGFVPMSHLSDKYVENPEELLGQTYEVFVIKVDPRKGRAVFSRRNVLLEEKNRIVAEIWANLNTGDIVEGKVMRFTDYGAFVDIGGVDGLLHISEISWGKLKHPQEVLKVGDIINVKILSLNEEKGKISLGLKQCQPEPWSLVGDKYQVNQVVNGKVVQIMKYGAFVELEAGLDGLVHISEIAHKHVDDVNDELKLGETVEVLIKEIDSEKKRISLSIKATLPQKEDTDDVEELEQIEQDQSEVEEVSEESTEE